MISSPPPPPDPIFTFRPRSGTVQSVQYANHNGKHSVLTGMSSGIVSLWDLGLKRQYWIQKRDGNVTSSKFIQNSNKRTDCIASLQKEGKLTLWNVETSSIICEAVTPDPGFCGLSVLECDGPRVIFADRDFGKINIFNFVTESIDTQMQTKEPKSRGMCMCATAFENGGVKHVLGGFEDGKVSCWDTRNPRQEISTVELFSEPVMCIDYNACTRHGVCGSPLSTLETFTCTENGQLSKKYSVPIKNSGVSSVRIRLDGKIMASGGWDGRIRIFGCKKGKPLAALNFHTDVVQCLDFAPNDAENYANLLMCGSKDERISLWKLY